MDKFSNKIKEIMKPLTDEERLEVARLAGESGAEAAKSFFCMADHISHICSYGLHKMEKHSIESEKGAVILGRFYLLAMVGIFVIGLWNTIWILLLVGTISIFLKVAKIEKEVINKRNNL